MRRSLWLLTLFSAVLAASAVGPVRAAQVGVKSLAGPPEEFASHRLPSAGEVTVPSGILMIDRGKRIVNGLTAGTTYSTFETSQGVGFSLVQVTTQYPYFSPATITGPNGSQFLFDGATITCNFGPCADYQADLVMEAFTNSSGGSVAFSISGGEVHGGTWGLALQDPAPAFALSAEPLQVESVISFDDNYVEVAIEPEPCRTTGEELCPVLSDATGRRRNAVFDLLDGATPVLRLSYANKAMRQKGLKSGIDVTALTVTVTDTRTRKTFLQKQLGPSRADGLWVDKSGASLVALPALPVGQYSVRLDVKGEVKGVGRVERTAFYTLPIIARPYEATGQVRAEAIDQERLKLLLEVEPLNDDNRHVYAYAEVWSRDGRKPIAWIGGMTQPEGPEGDSAGKVGLPILLDTRWLALAGESGAELLLRNVRIQDPDTFVPIDQIAELPVTVGKLPRAASLAKAAVVKDDSLYMGKGDRTITVPDGALGALDVPGTKHHNAAEGILLVHGWCSNPLWREWEFNRGPTAEFDNGGASRSHDAFALEIRDQGESHFNNAFTVVAHSQGGAAATHLRAFYFSRLDNSTAPRRIQSVGTPYGGSTLMDYYLATGPLGWLISEIFGFCGPQPDLGTLGSALWKSNIPGFARNDVFYYRTGYRRARTFWDKLQFWRWRCNLASFVIPGWDDGVVADFQGSFPGAHDMGITEGECHTDMNHGPQTENAGRNAIMDREGRPVVVVPLVGVIRGPAGCGNMTEHDVFFDNEDRRTANGRGGWIGATQSGDNTLLRLCGVNGQGFQAAANQGARFALVSLANTCPAGFTRFDRFHDNEDNNTTSWDSAPEGSPTDTVGSARNTNMAFCVATGASTGVANGAFPDLGVPYGVFGGRTTSLSTWALDRGYIHMDDEDNNNQNHPASPPGYTWEFLQPGGNTTYYMSRVR